MSLSSKILTGIFISLLSLSIAGAYYKFVVINDYLAVIQVDCDPTLESCFIWTCDPLIPDECSGNPEEDTWYYKFFYRNASFIPLCDPSSEEGCNTYICTTYESDCMEVLCTPETLALYEISGECSSFIDESYVTTNNDDV